MNASDTLTFTVKGTWNGPGAAPTSVNLLESSSATYSASGQAGGTLVANNATADDGLKDPATPTGLSSGISQGRHLTTMPVQGGSWTFTRTLAATSNFTDTMPAGGGGMSAGVGLGSYTVQMDNRAVSITCLAIETSYYKGYDENSLSYEQDANQRNPNGSITTDSAVSPPLTQPGAGTTWTASPTLLVQTPGFTSPMFSWSSTGAGSLSATGNTSHTQLSVSFPETTGDVLNQQSTVRLTATDSDAATGTNTYTIRWHYPDENWVPYGAQFQNSPLAFPSTGTAAVGGQVQIPLTTAYEGITLNLAGKILGGFLTTGAATIAIAQPETDPLIVGGATALGYTLSVQDPPPPPQPDIQNGLPAQFVTDVGTEVSIINGNIAGIFLPSRPRMAPAFAATVHSSGNYGDYTGDKGGQLAFGVTAYREQMQQNYTADSYGQHGYIGQAAGSAVFPGPWQHIWNWTWTATKMPAPSH